ncbi:MAG: hypothetical protein V4620_04475 [Bacteroidota bacterium]
MKRMFQLLFFVFFSIFVNAQKSKVLILDCNLRDVVYDYSVYLNGGSNASQIERILKKSDCDLKVIHTSYAWLMNSNNISITRNFKPDLLIIHTSAFFDPFNPSDIEVYTRLINFLSKFSQGYSGKVLVYSRNYFVQNGKQGLRQFILQKAPNLAGNLFLIDIKSFIDPESRIFLRNYVYNLLN